VEGCPRTRQETQLKSAIALAGGKSFRHPGSTTFSEGPKKAEDDRRAPEAGPITKDNLSVVIDAADQHKDAVCQGVKAGSVSVCK